MRYITVVKCDGDGYLAWHPELFGCMSDGNTPAEAIENLADALEIWLDHAREHCLPIPEPRALGVLQIDLEKFWI